MACKFEIGQLVRFTEYNTFGESDLFGCVANYYGSDFGLCHYLIKDYTDSGKIYVRKAGFMKEVTKEEEFLLFLERK